MFVWIAGSFRRLSLAKRFMLASMIILVAGTVGIGQWVGDQIEAGVVHRTATTTALYVGSFVAPYLQELGQSDALSAEHVAALSKLLQNTPLGRQIVAFKVWDTHGK